MAGTDTITDVVAWLERLPDGALIPPACVVKRLRGAAALFDGSGATELPESERPPPDCWRERLWTSHPDTRLSAGQAREALGKSQDALYKLTARGRIPHRKMDGSLVFVASELRAWITANEEQIVKAAVPLSARLKVVGS